MIKYEYLVERRNSIIPTKELNDLGILGWELVSYVVRNNVIDTFIFKRPIYE